MTKFLLGCCALAWTVSAAAFDHSHAALDRVLKQHVRDARVDYAALKSSRSDLDAYLRACAAVPEADFKRWPEAQQLAFLINVYNAATLQLIVDHYPVRSIKQIGGWFKSPWEIECVRLFGRPTTLDEVEHGLLRQNYDEPRIHFAIVCAAKGCPPLRTEAYTADRLNEQLADQGRTFLRTRANNRVDPGTRTVRLSPIFKWFSGDFARGDKSVLDFVTPYFTAADQQILASTRNWKIRYTDYDWSLNGAARQ
jgi:hypothetical protein